MKFHIARQPIFNRKMQVYAYELLYRRAESENFYHLDPSFSDDQASSSVILNSFYNYGLEDMTGGRPAFINFTTNLLNQQIATLFPTQSLVIEVLETVEATPEILQRCQELRSMGYRLALDDFVLTEKNADLAKMADIIKIDFSLSTIEEIQEMIAKIKRDNVVFLAEKIETKEMYRQAQTLNFSYFQGYFFARPVIVSGESLRPLPTNYLRLIQMVSRSDFSFRAVARIVMQDVFLSYQLLKLVNSVAFGFQVKIKTIHHALVALGTAEVRKWVSLVSMMGINSNVPRELHKISLTRAKFCESLAPLTNFRGDIASLFFTGLFSLMDVITERPFEAVCGDIAVTPETYNALVKKSGPHYLLLALAISYEQGKWQETALYAKKLGISMGLLNDIYLDAIRWCDSILDIGAA